jgi:hypothetical protein
MSRQRDHTWLSQARREAERQAAHQIGVASRLRTSAQAARGGLKEQAGRPAAILLVLAAVGVLHAPFLLTPEIRGLPETADSREFLFALWQVSAALLGIAFVVLIFIVETIHRSTGGRFVWERFLERSFLYPITAFFLGTIVAVGAGSLALLPSPDKGLPQPSGLANLVALDSALFLAALSGLLWLYYQAFRLADPAFVQNLAIESLSDTVRRAVSRTFLSKVEDHILRQECEALGFRYWAGTSDWPGMEAVRIDTPGTVRDVNLHELKNLAGLLADRSEQRAIVALGIGRLVSRDSNAGIFVHRGDLNEKVVSQVPRCFKIVTRQPERGPDLEAAFGFLTEQALESIRAGRLAQLGGVLDALQQPIRVALETLRSYGVVFDAATARNIFSFEWPALDRPFREYERIVEAAARSGDANIVREAAYWPCSVMSLSIQQRDHYFYRQAVAHLPYLYQLAQHGASERATETLRDRAWRHLKEFGTFQIMPRLQATGDVALIAALGDYATALLHESANLLRLAIDGNDRPYLEEAGRGLWQAIDIRFESTQLGLGEDPLDQSRHIPPARDLARAKADFLIGVANSRAALWMALGGWVCHRWATGRIAPDMAQTAFGQLSEPFGDFTHLWRAFNSALSAESGDRLPSSHWEMSEHPEGKVVFLSPEGHVALFFALVALTNIPADAQQRLQTLGTPGEARWAKGLVATALQEIKANPSRWHQLIGDADRSTQEAALAALMHAAEAEEERRERLHIMEQQLSGAKVADFKTEFLAAWVSGGLFRRLLDAADAIEYPHEQPPPGHTFGLWNIRPKGPFVQDTGGVAWMGAGGQPFGVSVASGEDNGIYEAMRKGARRYRLGKRTVGKKLSEILRSLRDSGFPPDVIILCGDWQVLRHLEQSATYTPFYANAVEHPPDFRGTFEGVPVYMRPATGESEFLVVSLQSVGHLVQYVTDDNSIFRRFEIKGYSMEEAREVAAGNRSWLPQDVRTLADDALVDYLRENVEIRIEQAFEMRIDQKLAARRLTVPLPS